jgi:DeoR family fructose operon transcriptional repressor
MAIVGPEAESDLLRIRAAKCFVGANGLTLEEGVSDPLPLEASVKRRMVEVSQEVYVVATHDKLGRVSAQLSVPLAAVDVVITDQGADAAYCARMGDLGIRCVVAD